MILTHSISVSLAALVLTIAVVSALADDNATIEAPALTLAPQTQASAPDWAAAAPAPVTFSALWENDSPPYNPFNSSDRHYTNGVRVAIVGTPDFAQPIADFIPDLTSHPFDPRRTVMGLVGGQ